MKLAKFWSQKLQNPRSQLEFPVVNTILWRLEKEGVVIQHGRYGHWMVK